jgi:hypothetical protein
MPQIRPEPPSSDEDHNLTVTVRSGDLEWADVLCKLWLPQRHRERPLMFLYPTGPEAHIIGEAVPPYSLEGRITKLDQSVVTIRAGEVWSDYASTRSLSNSRSETVMQVTPIDLRLLHRRTAEIRKPRVKARTQYHVTRCPPINAGALLQASYTGEIKLRKQWTFDLILGNGVLLKFAKVYRYHDRTDGTLSWTELVATREHEIDFADLEIVDQTTLDQLDDFLALVAFASHYRAACLSVHTTTDDLDQSHFYRGNVTIPPDGQDADPIDAVIDASEMGEFLRLVYANFVETGPHELVRHALHLVAVREERTMESDFTTLYAALETILLWYRRSRGLDLIIEDNEQWAVLERDVRAYLKSHAVLKGESREQKDRRNWIYGKVGELRRVPFRIAFRRFCEDYDLRLDDFWPMFNATDTDVSLTEIRNRIVHGGAFTRQQSRALIGAGQHMRWVVERALLAVLGWPLDRSLLKPSYLSAKMTAIAELQQDLAALRLPAKEDAVMRTADDATA